MVLGLVLLLLFQTFFLDDLYEFSKVHTVKTAASEMAQAVLTDEVEEYAGYWSVREDCEIYILNSEGNVTYSHGTGGIDPDHLKAGELRAYYDGALSSTDGTMFVKSEVELMARNNRGYKPPKAEISGGDRQPPPGLALNNIQTWERVAYAVLVEDPAADYPPVVLVTSMISPVDATIRVLQVQLLIAMVLFVAFAVLLAWFIAKKIALPIIDIHHAAKGLASGAYQAPPEGDYREVAELRQTLNLIDVELRKSEQLQRDLVANVSHDVRTPLTMIIGYAEAIRDLPGEDSAENIQVVIDEAERLTRLVNDILDLSRLQSGTQRIQKTVMNLTDVLRDVVNRVSCMTQKRGYHIELIADADVQVIGDELRLSQVIYNLLANALAHTGEDRTVIVRQTYTDDTVKIAFTDSGKGIPEEALANIWVRYYQVHSHERRRESMNSGLGLSIVRTLVERHDGTYGVQSTLEKGSTFWFSLPRV